MSEIRINKEELIEAIVNHETINLVIEKLFDIMSNEEVANFIHKIDDSTYLHTALEVLKIKGRLKKIAPMIWNAETVLNSFDDILKSYPDEFKDFILDAIMELSNQKYTKYKINGIIETSLLLSLKVEGLDKTEEFKEFIEDFIITDPRDVLTILLAHKIYGIFSDYKLKEVLDRVYKILKRESTIKYYNKNIVKRIIDLFLEFRKVENPRMMRKIMEINERLEDEDI